MIPPGQTKYRSSRVTELILPDFPPFDQSHVPMMMRARECDIALVMPSKQVFIPCTTKDIAAFWVDYNRRLNGLLDDVVDVAKDMGFSQTTIKTITDGVTICIEHQYLWVKATYEQLATIVLHSAAMRAGIEQPGVLDQISICLGASMQGVKELLPAVSKLLIDTSARHAIASFMSAFEKTYPESRSHSKELARLQLRLWRRVLEYRLFPFEFTAANWRHIVTSCIYAVTTVNDFFLTTEEISVAIGAGYAGISGYDMDTYLLSNIVYNKAYQIKNLVGKTRRQRKLQVRSPRHFAHDAVAAYPVTDPFARLDRSFESISFNEFADTTQEADGGEMEHSHGLYKDVVDVRLITRKNEPLSGSFVDER